MRMIYTFRIDRHNQAFSFNIIHSNLEYNHLKHTSRKFNFNFKDNTNYKAHDYSHKSLFKCDIQTCMTYIFSIDNCVIDSSAIRTSLNSFGMAQDNFYIRLSPLVHIPKLSKIHLQK